MFPGCRNTGKMVKALFVLVMSFSCVIASVGSVFAAVTLDSASAPPPIIADAVYRARAEIPPKLSFDFQNIDIRALLQLIAKNSGMNFMISDNVKGNVSVSLKDVSWNQALNIIMTAQALASRRIGNVIFISTLDEITSTEAKELKSAQDLANVAPIKTMLIKLKYTNATDLAKLLQGQSGSLLTSRGQVAVDVRTNSVIIRDTAKSLAEIIKSIRQIDIPTRQVLIEARIVNIDTTYEQDLGIRFGVSNTRNLSGTFAGANQLAQGTSVNNVGPPGTPNPSGTNRLNFNIPAATLFDGGTPGSIGLALAHVGHLMLDLELSALEGEEHGQVISRPRIITSNQQKAMIQTGTEIPYQEASSSGATSVTFKNAVLSLEVTPQITPDNKIMLKLKATQDTVGANIQVSNNASTPTDIPSINTQALESNVLLTNNETIVLGGVYTVTKEHTIDRIPFLGSLPMLGFLFRHTKDHNEKHELLIFITPKIITANSNKSVRRANAQAPKHVLNPEVYKD